MRDSQMSVSASARMLLDNASAVCGPQLEINTDLMRSDQDLQSIGAYKMWYREGTGQDAQFPAVRPIVIDSHLDDLIKVMDVFLKFADMETFVGPATGGDVEHAPSEPMRTAAGASMLRGEAALPFKDVIRRFDSTTQSVMQSLVMFNRKFNPKLAPEGDYNVLARGAKSLIAKELRGIQVDSLAQTMTPEEKMHVDERKFVEARFKVRDLVDLLLPADEAVRRQKAASDDQDKKDSQTQAMLEAQIRKLLSDAFKNVAQGQKNQAATDATQVKSALDLLENGNVAGPHPVQPAADPNAPQLQGPDSGAGGAATAGPSGAGGGGDGGGLPPSAGPAQGQAGGMPPGGNAQASGGGGGL